ncbi:hypothetical protein [Wukongibacter baidiensis]
MNGVAFSILKEIYTSILMLFEEDEKNRNKIFDEIIDPIYNNINELHINYLNDFKKYRCELESAEDFSIDFVKSLVNKIKTDSLYTLSHRNKLIAKLANLENKERFKEMTPFITTIKKYLLNCSDINCNIDLPMYLTDLPIQLKGMLPSHIIEDIIKKEKIELSEEGIRDIVDKYNEISTYRNVYRYVTYEMLKEQLEKLNDERILVKENPIKTTLSKLDDIVMSLQNKHYFIEEEYTKLRISFKIN